MSIGKSISDRFEKTVGISLRTLANSPALTEQLFKDVSSKDKAFSAKEVVGRGYPFFNRGGVSASLKDMRNCEILKKWQEQNVRNT